jgi:Domain of unknown function (DUF4135)
MDLNQLRAALSQLGVTLQGGDDDPPNFAAVLPDQRLYRASLYLRRLQNTRTFLTTTLNQAPPVGIGAGAAGYNFCRTALQSTTLIDALALELDQWVVPAVKNVVLALPLPNGMADYQNYFVNNILNVADVTYDLNVNNFFVQYPITDNALNQITNNFQQNIKIACDRILDDHANNRIRDLFIGQYPNLNIRSLKAIKSTGSDFHKGGKQVLILTFDAVWWEGWKPHWIDLKVVYKPTDLEIDCLLVGNSAAVNNVTPGFQVQSLAEIFNAWVLAHPNPGPRETLPTYRILPRNPTSAAPGFPLPVRNAYGYIEFLGHETSYSIGAANYYPLGSSDFLIFRNQDETTIIPRCYRQAGHWIALSCTFSLLDLHIENVRISKYVPDLIDLEISLTEPVATVQQTLLLLGGMAPLGGINGEYNEAETFAWVVDVLNPGAPNQSLAIEKEYVRKYFQNRLYALRPNKKLVPVNPYWLFTGLRIGMNVLQEIQNAGGFNAWIARINNVLVRVVPVATRDWQAARRDIYESTVVAAPPPAALPANIADALRHALTPAFHAYALAPTPEPRFMVYAAAAATTDLQNFDIPAFYHRIGSVELLDSTGAVMAVPATVTVNNPGPPPPTLVQNTNVGRVTYYAAAPTAANVQAGQIVALTGPGFNARRLGLRNDAMAALNVLVPPGNPGVLIP